MKTKPIIRLDEICQLRNIFSDVVDQEFLGQLIYEYVALRKSSDSLRRGRGQPQINELTFYEYASERCVELLRRSKDSGVCDVCGTVLVAAGKCLNCGNHSEGDNDGEEVPA